jgi:hypothetical protein
MHQHRYIVVSEREGWRIVRGTPRPGEPYPTKGAAICAAKGFAAREGFTQAEVLIREEDGYFATERVDCARSAADRASRRSEPN